MNKRGHMMKLLMALSICLSGCGNSQPSTAEVEHACLAACKQVIPDTVEVSVSDVRLMQLPSGGFQAAARVAERRAGDRVFNGLGKPITVVFAKTSSGWSPMNYDLMGTKGVLQGGSANRGQPVGSHTNQTSAAAGPGG